MTNPIDRFNRQVSDAISQFQEHPSDTALFSARVTELLSEIPSSITTEEQSSLLSRSLQDLTNACQTPELTPLAKRINNLQIEMNLNTWALAGTPEEGRVIAQRRILAFLHAPTADSLDLSSLKLADLPDIFGYPVFATRLTYLNLNHTPLTSLPKSFDSLTALRRLDLIYTQLTSLPESFGNLTALQDLSLSGAPFTSLPESFGNLTALQKLSLRATRLTSLPESFRSLTALQRLDLSETRFTSLPESFGNLTALRRLDLNDAKVTSLPRSFGNLTALQVLYLSETPLTSLPESFGSLTALITLELNDTPLTSLPESFDSLTALRRLELNGTPLTSLPSNITSLSHTLEIGIGTLPLSEEIRTRLQAATRAPEYNGPSFFYSMTHVERRIQDRRSTIELVRDLYQELGEAPPALNSELEESAELRDWLSRLSYMADYKAGGENKKSLLQNILSYLKVANENSKFREVFLAIIQGAAETCGDRVALSILQIGIAYKVHTADLSRPRDLALLLLKGIYAINLLENIARAKVSTLSFVDEIEVYLGYPLKLKEALDLPIDVKEMLYFRCSALTDADLSNAERFVKEYLNNPDTCHQFLIHHETWLKCLEKNYPREFEVLEAAKTADSEAGGENPDYAKIQADYEKGLIALTKKALDNRDDDRKLPG